MTFEQLCESMGWTNDRYDVGLWVYRGEAMAESENLTAAGAIAVQTEYKLISGTDTDGGIICLWPTFIFPKVCVQAPDIPTAIRDCAMEIEL